MNGSINVLSHHEKLLVDYHLFVESFSLCFLFIRVSRGKRMFTSHNRTPSKTIFDAFWNVYNTRRCAKCVWVSGAYFSLLSFLSRYDVLKNWIRSHTAIGSWNIIQNNDATTWIPLFYVCKQMANWNIIRGEIFFFYRTLFTFVQTFVPSFVRTFIDRKLCEENTGLNSQWKCWKWDGVDEQTLVKSIVIRTSVKITLENEHWQVHSYERQHCLKCI